MSPPKFEDYLNIMSREELRLLFKPEIGVTDYKGRYLHWDDLRYKPVPEGYTPELYWLAIKQSRQSIYKVLPFKDKHQNPMSYCIPEQVMKNILWLSEHATGAIIADEKINNPKTKQTYLINTLIEEAISSSQLEGAATTRVDAKEMIRMGNKPKDISETMILNNHRAMALIRKAKDDPLTPKFIFILHQVLTEDTFIDENQGKEGKLRDSNDEIGVYSYDNVLLHTPPGSNELINRLNILCDFCNQSHDDVSNYIPPVIKAIIVHFMIGYDHPFVDGNGRLARALFYWVMAKENFWLMEYISISRVIKKAPDKYQEAYLHAETDGNDLTYFIIHQLGVIKTAITDLHKYLQKKTEKDKSTLEMLENLMLKSVLNHRQLAMIRNAIENPGAEYTFSSHQLSHGIAYQTARTDLLELANNFNLLNRFKSGRKEIFVAPRDLRERIKTQGY